MSLQRRLAPRLSPARLQYLVTGDFRGADLDTFLFARHFLAPVAARDGAAVAELAALWREHEAAIRTAAGRAEPWCARWLREHAHDAVQPRPVPRTSGDAD
jgi:hypothetical protein